MGRCWLIAAVSKTFYASSTLSKTHVGMCQRNIRQ